MSLRCDNGAEAEVVISALKKKKKIKGKTNFLCLLRNQSSRRSESTRPLSLPEGIYWSGINSFTARC